MSSRIYDFQIKHVKYHGKKVMLIFTCTRIRNVSNSCTRQKTGVFRHVHVLETFQILYKWVWLGSAKDLNCYLTVSVPDRKISIFKISIHGYNSRERTGSFRSVRGVRTIRENSTYTWVLRPQPTPRPSFPTPFGRAARTIEYCVYSSLLVRDRSHDSKAYSCMDILNLEIFRSGTETVK